MTAPAVEAPAHPRRYWPDGGMPTGAHTLFTGGGPVFPDLVTRIRKATSAMRVVSVYGSTEAEPIAHSDAAEVSGADWRGMIRRGTVGGNPGRGGTRAIVDDEILVAGEHVVGGYLDPARDASTKIRDAHGTIWHRTGDAGRFDEQGRVWLRGRLDGRVAGLWPRWRHPRGCGRACIARPSRRSTAWRFWLSRATNTSAPTGPPAPICWALRGSCR